MKYEDKFRLTPEENRRFAKTNLTKLVFTNSRFEGLTTTMPQTQTVIDGLGVDGVPIDDINIIVQLKRGWQFAINEKMLLDLSMEKRLNAIVARDTAAFPGYLRNGSGGVETYQGEFEPPMIEEGQEQKYLKQLLASDSTATDKALTLMYHNMRQQMFYDGNKRTATIAANKIMIDNGAGLINVPLDKWPTWQQKLADYYFSNDMTDLKEWTYQNGIFGMEPNLQARAQHKGQEQSATDEKETIAEFKKMLKSAKKSKQNKKQQGLDRDDGPEL
ncbi:Fic family protein [uncultured Lactobacillus sp.]|uniref:Fic family protein n=1 Tax=uncultured Lactobacillus sp. TaxID=153152 RepID=UPI0025F68A5B|nr:Fic family protein [uncultured Lactobacillus sp.]